DHGGDQPRRGGPGRLRPGAAGQGRPGSEAIGIRQGSCDPDTDGERTFRGSATGLRRRRCHRPGRARCGERGRRHRAFGRAPHWPCGQRVRLGRGGSRCDRALGRTHGDLDLSPTSQAPSLTAQPLDLGLIGNCRVAALVNPLGRIVWWCVPRFDGDPVFCNLLSGNEEKGFCEVALEGMVHNTSSYRRNTAVIETVLTDDAGDSVRISDFAPRFKQFGRHFRPAQLVRRIETIAGLPRIRLRLRPTHDYGKPCHAIAGSNHIRFVGSGPDPIRLTTDAALSYVLHESPFVLSRPLHLIFGSDEPVNDAPDEIAKHFLEKTIDYWTDWVRALAIPYEWQVETIRAAITLKLCSFEETGA